MKSKKTIKILIFLAIMLITIIAFSNKVNAASFTLTPSSSSVNVGDNYIVTITGDNVTGKFSITGNSNVTITSSKSVWIENNSATVSVTAKTAGTGTITVTAVDVADSTTGAVFSGTKSSNVTIKEKVVETPPAPSTPATTTPTQTTPKEKSSNNKLSNLGIKPNDFTGFKPGTTTYNVTVPNDVAEVQVYASAQDSKAKISGTGKVQLQEGENQIKVTCKAENGSSKVYTINVTRSVAEQSTETSSEQPEQVVEQIPEEIQPEETPDLKLETLTVEGMELVPAFSSDVFEYTVNLTDGNAEKLNIQATSNYEQATIKIIGNGNFKIGSNQIVIEVKLEESDKTVKYVLNVNKPEISDEINEEIAKLKEEAKTKNNILKTVSVVLIGSVIGNVVQLIKKKQLKID